MPSWSVAVCAFKMRERNSIFFLKIGFASFRAQNVSRLLHEGLKLWKTGHHEKNKSQMPRAADKNFHVCTRDTEF